MIVENREPEMIVLNEGFDVLGIIHRSSFEKLHSAINNNMADMCFFKRFIRSARVPSANVGCRANRMFPIENRSQFRRVLSSKLIPEMLNHFVHVQHYQNSSASIVLIKERIFNCDLSGVNECLR